MTQAKISEQIATPAISGSATNKTHSNSLCHAATAVKVMVWPTACTWSELRTVIVDKQSSINVQQTAVITAQTEAPQATDRQFDVTRELQPVTLHLHFLFKHLCQQVAQDRALNATDRAHKSWFQRSKAIKSIDFTTTGAASARDDV